MGNLDDSIRLLQTDDVTMPLVVKMKTMVALGFEDEVRAGLALFQEAAFTTTLVEQAHASGALLMRRHPMLETHSLTARMTVHNCRMLFSHCPLERRLAHLSSLLEKVEKNMKGVIHTGARQMYVKALCEEVAAHLKQRDSGSSVRLSIFKYHSKAYSKLSPGQISALNQRAAKHNAKKIETLEESRTHIEDEMRLVKERHAQEMKSGKVNHMQSCRFTHEQFERFAELFPQYIAAEDRSRCLAPPKGLPPLMAKLMHDALAKMAVPQAAQPDWLPHLVDHRDSFAGVCLYPDPVHRTPETIFKVCLCIAQPRRAVFLECKRRRPGLDRFDYSYGRYECEAFRFVTHEHVPWRGRSELWVIPSVTLAGAEVRASGEPVPWSVYTRWLKKPAAQGQKSEGGTTGSKLEEILRLLLLEYPWLSEAELLQMLQLHGRLSPQTLPPVPRAGSVPGGASSSSSSTGGQGQQQEEEALAEDVVAAVNMSLEAQRAEVAASNRDGGDSHFKLRVLGGEWSVRLKKTITTDFGSYAKDKSVVRWCDLTGFPERKSFAVNRYGLHNARVLAEEVVRRGDHFFDGWVQEGSPAPFDFSALAASYVSPPDYLQWFDEQALNSWSARAAFEVRELVPMALVEDIDVPWKAKRK